MIKCLWNLQQFDEIYDNFGQEVNGIARTAATIQPVMTSFFDYPIKKDWYFHRPIGKSQL